MPLPRLLLLATAAAGALSVGAALLSARQASLQWGVATLATLAVYVAVAGRTAAPRVRWAALAGMAVLAMVMAARLLWLDVPTSDLGWFAWDESRRQIIDRQRLAALGVLLAVLCIAVGVLALPVRHRPRWAALATAFALVVMAVIGFDLGRRIGDAPVLGLLETAWPALFAMIVAVGLVALSGWRGDRPWLVLGGAALVAVAAGTGFDELMSAEAAWQAAPGPPPDAVIVSVSVATPQLTASLDDSANDVLRVSAALEMALALAGPVLLAVGVLRASRGVGPAQSGSESS